MLVRGAGLVDFLSRLENVTPMPPELQAEIAFGLDNSETDSADLLGLLDAFFARDAEWDEADGAIRGMAAQRTQQPQLGAPSSRPQVHSRLRLGRRRGSEISSGRRLLRAALPTTWKARTWLPTVACGYISRHHGPSLERKPTRTASERTLSVPTPRRADARLHGGRALAAMSRGGNLSTSSASARSVRSPLFIRSGYEG